jgi:hypothetical protein
MTLYKLLCQPALLKRLAKVSFIESGLETRLAKTPCESVLYKKWPRNPPCQNAPLKRLIKVSFIESGLETCPAKTPYKSVLYRKWPRNPPC